MVWTEVAGANQGRGAEGDNQRSRVVEVVTRAGRQRFAFPSRRAALVEHFPGAWEADPAAVAARGARSPPCNADPDYLTPPDRSKLRVTSGQQGAGFVNFNRNYSPELDVNASIERAILNCSSRLSQNWPDLFQDATEGANGYSETPQLLNYSNYVMRFGPSLPERYERISSPFHHHRQLPTPTSPQPNLHRPAPGWRPAPRAEPPPEAAAFRGVDGEGEHSGRGMEERHAAQPAAKATAAVDESFASVASREAWCQTSEPSSPSDPPTVDASSQTILDASCQVDLPAGDGTPEGSVVYVVPTTARGRGNAGGGRERQRSKPAPAFRRVVVREGEGDVLCSIPTTSPAPRPQPSAALRQSNKVGEAREGKRVRRVKKPAAPPPPLPSKPPPPPPPQPRRRLPEVPKLARKRNAKPKARKIGASSSSGLATVAQQAKREWAVQKRAAAAVEKPPPRPATSPTTRPPRAAPTPERRLAAKAASKSPPKAAFNMFDYEGIMAALEAEAAAVVGATRDEGDAAERSKREVEEDDVEGEVVRHKVEGVSGGGGGSWSVQRLSVGTSSVVNAEPMRSQHIRDAQSPEDVTKAASSYAAGTEGTEEDEERQTAESLAELEALIDAQHRELMEKGMLPPPSPSPSPPPSSPRPSAAAGEAYAAEGASESHKRRHERQSNEWQSEVKGLPWKSPGHSSHRAAPVKGQGEAAEGGEKRVSGDTFSEKQPDDSKVSATERVLEIHAEKGDSVASVARALPSLGELRGSIEAELQRARRVLESTAHLSAASQPDSAPAWQAAGSQQRPPRHPASALPSRAQYYAGEEEDGGGSSGSSAEDGSDSSTGGGSADGEAEDDGDAMWRSDLRRVDVDRRRADSPVLPEGDEDSDEGRRLRHMRRPDAPTPLRMARGPSDREDSPAASDGDEWEDWGARDGVGHRSPLSRAAKSAPDVASSGNTASSDGGEEEAHEHPPSRTAGYYHGAGYDDVLLDLMAMGITNIDDIPTPEGSSIMERLSDSEETESQAKGNADGAAPSEQQSRLRAAVAGSSAVAADAAPDRHDSHAASSSVVSLDQYEYSMMERIRTSVTKLDEILANEGDEGGGGGGRQWGGVDRPSSSSPLSRA